MQHTTVLGKVIKRLALIKGLILLEEFEDIETHLMKLKEFTDDEKVSKIIEALESKLYADAVRDIEVFTNDSNRITIYEDPEIESLKIEIKKLEIEVSSLSDEIAETEKLIHDFGVRHSRELGELISKILRYRKVNAEKKKEESESSRKEFEEAEADYENYRKQYDASKLEELFELTLEEQKEIKSLYRKASKMCHPDVVADELKENAEVVFRELQKAYEKNDLKKVREIFEMLSKGEMFINKSESITEKVKLRAELIKLRNKATELKGSLDKLVTSDTYKTIIEIEDWDIYFKNTKAQLSNELNTIEN